LRYTNEKLSLDYQRSSFFNPVAGFFDPITLVNTAPPISTLAFKANREINNVSGRIGVQWKPQSNLNFYGSYNRGYKGPAANTGRTPTGPDDAIIKPEIADAFELGAKLRLFDNMMSFDVALYKQRVKNIQQSSLIEGITPTLINAGALDIKGVELNVGLRPVEGLSINGGLVYNDAKYDGDASFPCGPSVTPRCPNGPVGIQSLDGQRAIASPKWKVVSSANYEFGVSDNTKLGLRVGYTWRSATQFTLYSDPLTSQPSYGLLDASVTLSEQDDKWQVSVFGKNLTDKFFYSNLNTADFFIGRSFGNVGRDARRYFGMRLSYNY
jgi:iron complex outermembrane receptor protein